MNPEGLEREIRRCARSSGVDTVGYARMDGLQSLFHQSIQSSGHGFEYGISLAFRLSDAVLESLVDGPTLLYKHHYKTANWMLDQCAARVVRLLEDADLVRSEKDGMWNNFRLAKPEETNPYSRVILDHLQKWLEDDMSIRELLEQTKVVDRATCGAQ